MLTTASGQVGFFDAAELIGPLPEGSFYALLAEYGERIVSDGDFVDCYSERQARPSIPPSKLAKVMLLQYRTGLSDREAMEAVRWDLRWKAALDLPVDHSGWDPSSLTRFRARLLLHGKERLVLENSLAVAEEVGLLEAPAEQIVYSTPMLGAAATQDTVRLVRSGVRGCSTPFARSTRTPATSSTTRSSSTTTSQMRSPTVAGASVWSASGC